MKQKCKKSIFINDIKALSTFQIEVVYPNIMNIKYGTFTLKKISAGKVERFSSMIKFKIEMPTKV